MMEASTMVVAGRGIRSSWIWDIFWRHSPQDLLRDLSWKWQKIIPCLVKDTLGLRPRETGMTMELLTEMRENCKRSRWSWVDDFCSWEVGTWCFIVLFFFFFCVYLKFSIIKSLRRKKKEWIEEEIETERIYNIEQITKCQIETGPWSPTLKSEKNTISMSKKGPLRIKEATQSPTTPVLVSLSQKQSLVYYRTARACNCCSYSRQAALWARKWCGTKRSCP